MQQTKLQNLWNLFGAKYVLSTPNSKRKESLRKNFLAVGLDSFEIVDFEPSGQYNKFNRNDSNGLLGIQNQSLISTMKHDVCDETCRNIAENMFTLAKKGYDAGHQSIVIFEDDARFEIPFKTERFQRTLNWMANHEWDIFYLGYCQWPMLLSWFVTPEVVKLTSPMCLHGYCLSRSGMEKVMKMSQYYNIQPQHIDKIYAEKDWKKYGIFPAICFQSEDPALFKKAIEKLPIDMDFKSLSRISEYSSVSIPIISIIIIMIFLTNIIMKK